MNSSPIQNKKNSEYCQRFYKVALGLIGSLSVVRVVRCGQLFRIWYLWHHCSTGSNTNGGWIILERVFHVGSYQTGVVHSPGLYCSATILLMAIPTPSIIAKITPPARRCILDRFAGIKVRAKCSLIYHTYPFPSSKMQN